MSQSKIPLTRERMLGGVNTTERPHLVGEEEWIRAHNVRVFNSSVEQIPPVVSCGALSGSSAIILSLITIPTGNSGEGLLVALTADGAYTFNAVSNFSYVSETAGGFNPLQMKEYIVWQ